MKDILLTNILNAHSDIELKMSLLELYCYVIEALRTVMADGTKDLLKIFLRASGTL